MTAPEPPREPRPASRDEVIRLEDLAPRRDVGGGRKIALGESETPRAPDAAGA